MKRYVKNKNFLPVRYINNMNVELQKRERIDCIVLFIVCMILLPHTISIVCDKEQGTVKEYVDNKKDGTIDKDKLSKNESLNNSIEYINKISEGNLNNGDGEIYIEGKEKLAEYINNKKITINTIEDLGEDRYRLQINEK